MVNAETEAVDHNETHFECTICLDTAKEPVVTACGHLFCWACIFQWLKQPRETLMCPVCKSGITQEELTPIYIRGRKDQR